jgi:hypothetical protein
MWNINNSMDNIHMPPLNQEELKTQNWGFNKAFDNINSKLALQWLKIELPDNSIQEKEKKIHNIVWNEFFTNEDKETFHMWITVKYISNWLMAIYSNESKNISMYFDEKWNELLSPWFIAFSMYDTESNKFFPTSYKAMEVSWIYLDRENWKRDLYEIIWKDWNWKFILGKNPIPVSSIQYFNAWKKLALHDDTLMILFKFKEKLKLRKDNVESFSRSWALNLKYLMLFEEKWLLESPDLLNYWLKLLNITENDIKKAYENWEITKEQAIKVYSTLKEKSFN